MALCEMSSDIYYIYTFFAGNPILHVHSPDVHFNSGIPLSFTRLRVRPLRRGTEESEE